MAADEDLATEVLASEASATEAQAVLAVLAVSEALVVAVAADAEVFNTKKIKFFFSETKIMLNFAPS